MSYSVLIIDDEPMICKGLLGMVNWQKHGFTKTDIRFDYEEGLAAAMTYPYSLIITDIRLHEESGLEIVRKVRQAGRDSMFVLISAHAEFSYAQTALELSVCQYLLKPIRKNDLELCITRIAALLSQKSDTPSIYQTGLPEPPPSHAVPGSRRTANVKLIQEYLHQHYRDQDLSLSKVASAFYMNASYLGQCFRQQTGVKFTDYLNQYRIQKACELLEEDAYLTYEIKDLVGFKNQNYFHTVFRKLTGVSTEEYRRQHLKKD